MIDEVSRQDFQTAVWDYYHQHGRHDMLWRQPEADGFFDPYKIMVSELMLQQTQVSRVIPKYQQFLEQFPTIEALAKAQLGDVLRAWNGLGYNRRAKFLHVAAQQLITKYDGKFPDNQAELVKLAGIGQATASAILAYAFDQPVVFVETNIRTVFIHHFFDDRTDIPDKELLEIIKETLPEEHSREWYWALMDYGSSLKKAVGNLNRQSKSYAKQSRFEGSLRQVRGQVLRSLGAGPRRLADLRSEITDDRLDGVVAALVQEGMIRNQDGKLSL
jgi:A/G-specific adenine glycosylase